LEVKPRLYLETSVVSYLVGRLSRDVVVLGNQELTREWLIDEQSAGVQPAGHLHTARTDRGVMTIWEDPIVKETRAAREELLARFNHDLGANSLRGRSLR
jgi:hypothetical protein